MKTKFHTSRCLFLFFVFTFIVLKASPQQQDTIVPIDEDPEKILRNIELRDLTNGGFNFWQDDFTGHFSGLDFGFNAFLNEDYTGYSTEFLNHDFFRSNSTYINVIQQSIGLQRNRNTIGLVTGLGLHLQSYRLNRNTTIRLDENGRVIPEILYYNHNQKSKFSVVSLMVPLLAEIQVPINNYRNRFYISFGPYAAVRLSAHTKIKYRLDRKEKLKIPGHYSLQDFKYGLMLRTGYRFVNLFATYELSPLFLEGKGPKLHAFNVGFSILSF